MITRTLASADASASDGRRRALWIGLLLVASAVLSLGLSCACPFAAFGAAAAMVLGGRDALLLTGGAWLANQVIGFGLLGYPWDASTVAWGVVLGGVALLATLAAQGVVRALNRRSPAVVAVSAFLVAFLVYEGALLVVAAGALLGVEDFAPGIIVRILAINAGTFAGLLALSGLGALVRLVATLALGIGSADHA